VQFLVVPLRLDQINKIGLLCPKDFEASDLCSEFLINSCKDKSCFMEVHCELR
jgi:hypothetical protein